MLREHLQTMTENEDVSAHEKILREISLNFPNTIRMTHTDDPIACYTCVMHALEFVDRPEYGEIANFGIGRIYAGAEFMHWLINHERITETENPIVNDYVLYFQDNGEFKHIGLLLDDGRVLSKWGTGHLYEHSTLEVPAIYGAIVRYYRHRDADDMYFYFKEFAEDRGVIFEEGDT